MQKRAVLFDLDGVLVTTDDCHYSHVFLPIEKVQPQATMQMNCGGRLKKHLPQMQNDTPTGVTFSTQDLDADGLCFQWDMSAARSNMQLLLTGDHNAV